MHNFFSTFTYNVTQQRWGLVGGLVRWVLVFSFSFFKEMHSGQILFD